MRDVNQHVTCSLCAGYLVDATTITECLHTCKLKIFQYMFCSVLSTCKYVKIEWKVHAEQFYLTCINQFFNWLELHVS